MYLNILTFHQILMKFKFIPQSPKELVQRDDRDDRMQNIFSIKLAFYADTFYELRHFCENLQSGDFWS